MIVLRRRLQLQFVGHTADAFVMSGLVKCYNRATQEDTKIAVRDKFATITIAFLKAKDLNTFLATCLTAAASIGSASAEKWSIPLRTRSRLRYATARLDNICLYSCSDTTYS